MKSLKIVMWDFIPNFWHFSIVQSLPWLLLLLFSFGGGFGGEKKRRKDIFLGWGWGGVVGFETILTFGRGDGVMKEG